MTRFYISYTGSVPTAAELVTFAGLLVTGYGFWMLPYTDESTTLTGATCIDLSSDTGAEGSATADDAGSLAGTVLPADACCVIGYEIARRYRGGHPRGYLRLGVGASMENAQTWSSAFLADVLTAIDGLFSAIAGDGWSGAGTVAHVNVSFYEGFTVVTNPTTHRARNVPTVRGTPLVNTVTSYAPRVDIGSQRRRIHKVR